MQAAKSAKAAPVSVKAPALPKVPAPKAAAIKPKTTAVPKSRPQATAKGEVGAEGRVSNSEAQKVSPHLLPTPLSRQARKYIVDMEGRSGLAIPGEQRQLLNQALKNRKFEKLPAMEAKKT